MSFNLFLMETLREKERKKLVALFFYFTKIRQRVLQVLSFCRVLVEIF